MTPDLVVVDNRFGDVVGGLYGKSKMKRGGRIRDVSPVFLGKFYIWSTIVRVIHWEFSGGGVSFLEKSHKKC